MHMHVYLLSCVGIHMYTVYCCEGVFVGVFHRAGRTGPAAPVLAGPIFQAPTMYFLNKT